MTLAIKIISGATGSLIISAAPVSYIGYTTWDKNNPTGEAWLLSSGYRPNKPTFKSQDHLRHGCSENLFSNDKKEPDPTKDSKLYGCAVMSMDLGDAGVNFDHGRDPKYIKFNSEIAIRKGSEGWVINSRVDNWTNNDSIEFNYILTKYKHKSNGWEKEGESKLWKDPEAPANAATPVHKTNPSITEDSQGNAVEGGINIHDKNLVIKTPRGSWWNSKEWISPSATARTKTKKHLWTKHWSGAWIHDEQENSWIFQDIELFVGEKKYSQVFCQGETNACFQRGDGMTEKTHNTSNLDTWQNASNNKQQNSSEKVEDMVKQDISPIIEKLKDLKGKWVDLDEVCGVTKNRNLNDDQKNKLKMFCTNGKKT